MNLKRISALLTVLLLIFALCPGQRSYALSDVDFTIDVDNSKEYVSGQTVEAPIVIKTQTDNGYVEMTMLLKYNADALSCETILNDWEGFTTEVVEEGLKITYLSPDGTRSKIDSKYTLMVKFAVRTGVASGAYPLELVINKDEVYGLDKNGNKEAGLLTISDAKTKELTIVETNDDNITQANGDGSDPNYYFTEPSVTQEVDNKGGRLSAGAIIGLIIGAMVIFAGGVVVGFILCQKRMLEEGDTGSGVTPDRGSRYQDDGFGSGRGRRIFDQVDDDMYSRPQRSVSRTPSIQDDDAGVDTSYFGGAPTRFEPETTRTPAFEEDDDDGFPGEFIPNGYQSAPSDQFGSYGVLDRQERGDDGYGSFETDDDYYSDRRKYR